MYKKKLPLGIRIVFGFLSVLLCICLFATTLLTIVVADLNTVTSKDGLQTIITQILFPKSAPVRVTPKLSGDTMAGLGGFSGIDFSSGGLNQNALIDSIYDMVAQQSGGELPISKEEVGELLEETTIPDFISDKMSSIVSDVITGEVTTTITKEEVMELIKENADVIEEKLDIQIENEVIESVGTWIEESEVMDTVQQEINTAIGVTTPATTPGGPEGVAPAPVKPHKAPTTILDLLGPDVKAPTSISDSLVLLRAVSSTNSLLICIGACVAIFLLLLLTHWGRPFAAVRSAGVPIMIAGIVMLLPGLISAFIPAGNMMVLNIIQKILGMTLTISIIVALVGLAMIISGSILNSVFKRKAKQRAAFAVAPVATPVYAPAAPVYVPTAPAAPVAPIDEAPAEKATINEAPVEEATINEAPVEEATIEEAAEETTSIEEPAVEEPTPAEAEQTPATQK